MEVALAVELEWVIEQALPPLYLLVAMANLQLPQSQPLPDSPHQRQRLTVKEHCSLEDQDPDASSSEDFESKLEDPVTMLQTDELFFGETLVPLQLPMICTSIASKTAMTSTSNEILSPNRAKSSRNQRLSIIAMTFNITNVRGLIARILPVLRHSSAQKTLSSISSLPTTVSIWPIISLPLETGSSSGKGISIWDFVCLYGSCFLPQTRRSESDSALLLDALIFDDRASLPEIGKPLMASLPAVVYIYPLFASLIGDGDVDFHTACDHRLMPGPTALVTKLIDVCAICREIASHCGADAAQVLPLNLYAGTVVMDDQFSKIIITHIEKETIDNAQLWWTWLQS
ncbi:hypothetical protein NE237_007549 [Protea cynaroides]|uniref:Uncharacterized protein n=1 Tax=Protea cynaroides TaxID=273540 RepID=A0A9Q0KPP5_9MAGN|nr:hypothetical protein NE237_007549 [Protea cynaroides]